MKCQALFSLKKEKKMSSAAVMIRLNPRPAEPGYVLLLKTE